MISRLNRKRLLAKWAVHILAGDFVRECHRIQTLRTDLFDHDHSLMWGCVNVEPPVRETPLAGDREDLPP